MGFLNSLFVPHLQLTASQHTVWEFHLDFQYNVFHWGSTILGVSELWKKNKQWSGLFNEPSVRRSNLTQPATNRNNLTSHHSLSRAVTFVSTSMRTRSLSLTWHTRDLHDWSPRRVTQVQPILIRYRCNRLNIQSLWPMGAPLIARFMGPTWGPSGADRTQVGPMLAPWTLLSGTTPKSDCKAGYSIMYKYMIDLSHKSHNASVPYPTMHHSEQKYIYFCSEWCIVGYGTGHNTITTVPCAKFPNNLMTGWYVMRKRDFAICELKMSFRGTSYFAPNTCSFRAQIAVYGQL